MRSGRSRRRDAINLGVYLVGSVVAIALLFTHHSQHVRAAATAWIIITVVQLVRFVVVHG